MSEMTTALGAARLQRYPRQASDQLQAWDAADEYLLNHVAEQTVLDRLAVEPRILLVNDQFGALAVALSRALPAAELVSWSDSWLAHQGTQANIADNAPAACPRLLRSTDSLEGRFDLVLIKIPKTLALLEHQLAGLAAHLGDHCVVLGAAMTRHIHSSTLALFERYLGTVTTSLARKKARLVFAATGLVQAGKTPASPYPDSFPWPGHPFTLSNHANVFSRSSLDIGSRTLLEVIDKLPNARHIVDLGCGNGVLGIAAQLQQPAARLSFVDESYMAVASAEANWQSIVEAAEGDCSANFIVNDGLVGLKMSAPDLIICNPPFHQGNAVGDEVAWRMLRQSRSHLADNGELWVVGNRHMGYHNKLKKLFGNCKLRHSNRKFVVLAAKNIA
jgi:16S rRNA G1207 methylase RsmC